MKNMVSGIFFIISLLLGTIQPFFNFYSYQEAMPSVSEENMIFIRPEYCEAVSENQLIIQKIGVQVPIQEVSTDSLWEGAWGQLEEDIQNGLKEGVVHYPATAHPYEKGNFFITGHSSYYPEGPGKYKTIFARLGELETGDTYTVCYEGKRYDYEIFERKITNPTDVTILDQPFDEKISTLMTTWPIGTAWKRLVVIANLVDLRND